MDDKLSKELHALKSEQGNLERRRNELAGKISEIKKRILEIKWTDYPIGSTVKDKNGAEYVICGYAEFWPIGYKLKIDGTPGKKAVSIYNMVEK